MVNACEASTDPRVVCHDRTGSNEGAGTCISRAATYEEAYSTFRWEVPARFNIARAICDDHAARTPDAPALLYEQADGQLRAWSFAEIAGGGQPLRQCAGAPSAWRRGTIVGIHLPQCPESLIAHVAIQKLGAIALPMFNLFGPDAIAYRLGDSGARVLISTPEALERNAEALRGIDTLRQVVSVGGAGPASAQDFWQLRRARIAARRRPPTPARTIRRC